MVGVLEVSARPGLVLEIGHATHAAAGACGFGPRPILETLLSNLVVNLTLSNKEIKVIQINEGSTLIFVIQKINHLSFVKLLRNKLLNQR